MDNDLIQKVIDLLLQGYSNTETAKKLNITRNRVNVIKHYYRSSVQEDPFEHMEQAIENDKLSKLQVLIKQNPDVSVFKLSKELKASYSTVNKLLLKLP